MKTILSKALLTITVIAMALPLLVIAYLAITHQTDTTDMIFKTLMALFFGWPVAMTTISIEEGL